MPRRVEGEELLALAKTLEDQGRADDAHGVYQVAVRDDALRVRALIGVARLQARAGRPREAIATLDEAVLFEPENASARLARGGLRLLIHDFAGGWDDYEYRLSADEFLRTGMPAPLASAVLRDARPEDLAGRRVLLVGEQGLGELVMFASVVPDLQRLVGRLTIGSDDRLKGLFASSFPGVVANGSASLSRSEFDVLLAMGSAARLFRQSLADFPGTAYLRPSDAVKARWAERLGPPSGLRIGLSWRGGVPTTGASRRSVDLARLKPLLELPDCEFVSLQYGDVAADIAAAEAALGVKIRAFPQADLHDYEETAGLVANLDAVVSVQTALVHLCGALGQTCLAMLPANPEPATAYGETGDRMPWYASVRLFRQPAPGDWEPVIAAVAETLRSRL